MNYIDVNSLLPQTLNINTFTDSVDDAIAWSIVKDGNDTGDAFTTPSEYHSLTGSSYYQMLSIDLVGDGIVLDDESHYLLEGYQSGELIYRGKFFTTSRDAESYSVNQGNYQKINSNKNYIILE